jgi:subtilase family serine protease
MNWRAKPVITIFFIVLVACSVFAAKVVAVRAMQAHVTSSKRTGRLHFTYASSSPPTDSQCRASTGSTCYNPLEVRNAYGITPLINQGITGRGQTILIVDPFGSPTLTQDLYQFDKDYGLPDPPSLRILSPLGTTPFDPNDTNQFNSAVEANLDVQWAHAIAPGANIIVLTSPVAETEGVQGLPQLLQLEQYALKNHLGNIISQSWAATENTLFDTAGKAVISAYENFYQQAAAQHVTIFSSTGDTGSSNVDINNNTYPFPTVGFPASSPYVTSVGGTSLYADTSGNYQRETVWDEVASSGGAGGGGISQYFGEPIYQHISLPVAVQQQLKGYRAIPDISYNADSSTGILVYIGFLSGQNNGYYYIGGTSEGSPQWAGIIADANQLAGHPLGFLNPALYSIGANGVTENRGYHDITVGNNGYNNVPGYNATTGWDLASGWGTPRVAALIPLLIGACHYP